MSHPRPYRIALNGYGRIGRCVLRALHGARLLQVVESITIIRFSITIRLCFKLVCPII